jgi:molybdopterin-guanine dinucleotide biosynthesis protein MobB
MGSSSGSTPVRRVHIVGRKNSGKTTLIVEIIEWLTARGLRVGSVKHTHHHHELDTPGKDSFRHRQAGATVVGIMAPSMDAIFRPIPEPMDDQTRYDRMMTYFADCDLVLVEGHVAGPGKKIEVWRSAISDEPIARGDPTILAVISDNESRIAQPVYRRSDIRALAELVVRLASD